MPVVRHIIVASRDINLMQAVGKNANEMGIGVIGIGEEHVINLTTLDYPIAAFLDGRSLADDTQVEWVNAVQQQDYDLPTYLINHPMQKWAGITFLEQGGWGWRYYDDKEWSTWLKRQLECLLQMYTSPPPKCAKNFHFIDNTKLLYHDKLGVAHKIDLMPEDFAVLNCFLIGGMVTTHWRLERFLRANGVGHGDKLLNRQALKGRISRLTRGEYKLEMVTGSTYGLHMVDEG